MSPGIMYFIRIQRQLHFHQPFWDISYDNYQLQIYCPQYFDYNGFATLKRIYLLVNLGI